MPDEIVISLMLYCYDLQTGRSSNTVFERCAFRRHTDTGVREVPFWGNKNPPEDGFSVGALEKAS
jgi:hypothetical protein